MIGKRTLLFASLALAHCGTGASTLDVSENRIVGGAPSRDFGAVVAVGPRPSACGAPLVTTCTGTLVTARAVVTAAHCVEGNGLLAVFFGGDVRGEGVLVDVAEARVHPQFAPAASSHDVAVLLLASDAPVVAIARATARLAEDDVGAKVDVVGFGAPRADAPPAGIKRAGRSVVAALSDGTFRVEPSPDLICGGDSGGPAILLREGTPTLVGVAAEGDAACSAWARYEDVGAHGDFLDRATRDPPRALRAAASACTTPCARDEDCPPAHECHVDADGASRCALPPLPIGALGASCRGDGECRGSACVRELGSSGCRCLDPCVGGRPSIRAGGGGCSLSTRGAAFGWLVVVAFLLAARGRRRRGRGCGVRRAS